MSTYRVTFLPKAGAKTCAMTIDVEADKKYLAESLARHQARSEGLDLSQFKHKLQVAIVRDETEPQDETAGEPLAFERSAVGQAQDLTLQAEPRTLQAEGAEVWTDEKLQQLDQTLEQVDEMEASAADGINAKAEKLAKGERLRIENLPMAIYRAADGVSTSSLKNFLECPAIYKASVDGLRDKDSSALSIGRAVHDIILLPDTFATDYIMQPDSIKTRNGKTWSEFKEAHEGKEILRKPDWDTVHAMRDAILAHQQAKTLLTAGTSEVSYWYRHPQTGLLLKCRVDHELGDLAVDLKSSACAEPGKWGRDAKRLNYDIQDAMYRMITGLPEMAFVAQEKEPPYIITAPLIFDEEARHRGEVRTERALAQLAQCIKTDTWPTYTDLGAISYVGLTEWERREVERLEAPDMEQAA